MSETRSRALSAIALLLGTLLAVAGIYLVGIYLVGVIEIIAEEPSDRSWLFWGLGIAFVGISLLAGGVALLFVWRKLRNRDDDLREMSE